MILTNGAALWLALLVPVVVFAYFIRRKIRRRTVSCMFLWDETLNSALAPVRGFRARNLLALILALLITLALITALVGPTSRNAERLAPIALIIDNSRSMNARDHDGKTRFQRAIELARRIVDNKADECEILILTTAPNPEIASGFANDFDALRRRLEEIEQNDRPGDVRETIKKARFFQSARGENAKIILLSDGAFQEVDETTKEFENDDSVLFYRIGDPVDNLALLNLTARRSPNGDPSFETLIDVANYSDSSVELNVELELNGELLDIVPLELEPNQRVQKIVANSSELGGALRAKIARQTSDFVDALELDDELETSLANFPHITIKLVGEPDLFLETVLNAQPNATVERVDAVPQTLQSDELLVLCGSTPTQIPQGNVAIIAPDASCNLFELGDEIPETTLEGERLDEGLARYLKFNDLILHGVHKLELAQGLSTIVYARAPEAPALLEIRDDANPEKGRVFLLNFSTSQSDLGLKTLFPILFANLVGEARGTEADKPFANSTPRPEESNLRVAPSNKDVAQTKLVAAQTPVSTLCAAIALALALLEFYLFCRRRVE